MENARFEASPGTRDLLTSGDLHINQIKFYYIPTLR